MTAALAHAPDTHSAAAHETERQFVAFRLADETYALDIALIQEIIRLQEITQIPRTSPDVEGVINLRGRIVPVVNLRRRLSMPVAPDARTTRIVVVALDDGVVGLRVDSVTGVLRLPPGCIEAPGSLSARMDTAHIQGIGKLGDELIILLDSTRILRGGSVEGIAA